MAIDFGRLAPCTGSSKEKRWANLIMYKITLRCSSLARIDKVSAKVGGMFIKCYSTSIPVPTCVNLQPAEREIEVNLKDALSPCLI